MVSLYIGGFSLRNEFPYTNNVIHKYDVILACLSLQSQVIITQ
jgi:hypothetical protein